MPTAPSRVQKADWVSHEASGGAFTSFDITFPSPVTAGNLLVLAIAHKLASRIIGTVTDTQGNTGWTFLVRIQHDAGTYIEIWTCAPVAAGTTTVTCTVIGGLSSVCWLCGTEVQGADPDPFYRGGSGYPDPVATTSHVAASGPFATGDDSYVFVAGQTMAYNNVLTPGAGFSLVDDQDTVGDGTWTLLAEDKSNTGAFSTDGPWSGDLARLGATVAFYVTPVTSTPATGKFLRMN